MSKFTEKMYRSARTSTRGMVTGEPHEPVRHTWGEVHERARCIAGGLAAAGVGRGDAVGVLAGLPVEIAPTADEMATGSFYEALRAHGAVPKVARQRIGARTATAAEAKMLDESPRAALLTMERTAYDDAGKAVEFGQHIYRASRYMFDTTLFAS